MDVEVTLLRAKVQPKKIKFTQNFTYVYFAVVLYYSYKAHVASKSGKVGASRLR